MSQKHLAEIRSFNRFYTDIIGLVDQYILDSKFTLAEVRILYEISNHNHTTASDIISRLRIDKGYLSRMLMKFERKNLITRKMAEKDGRVAELSLTIKGKKEFEKLNEKSNSQMNRILRKISPENRDKLIQHFAEVKKIFQEISENS